MSRLSIRNVLFKLSGAVAIAASGGLFVATLMGVPAPEPALADNSGAFAEPLSLGGPPTIRRLNEDQYRRSIADIFGTDIKVPGRFDPVLREDGLLAIGDSHVNVSASGLEQNELRARQIAAQVLSESKRKNSVPCQPTSATVYDQECAALFFNKYGRLLYRRPLSKADLASVSAVASAATASTQNFYRGLEQGLARLLYSPNFIFRLERGEPDPARPGKLRLDSYSLASRISFFLWNAPPDASLLDAAASGALNNPALLEQQIDRMMASPRYVAGVRAFFGDMLGFNQFDGLTKDQAVFQKFTSPMANDAREQVLKTIVHLLVEKKGDYRDIFTTRETYLSRNLGALYEIPIEDGAGIDGWVPYTFTPEDQRAGILSMVGMMMLDPSHEGRSSPTNRGKLVREALMCQQVPAPPPNVDFKIVQDTASTVHPTARERLALHRENPVCAGCHKITDPIGLAMENYDAVGAWREKENGALIDASGIFEGKSYKNALDLSQLLHDSPAIPECVVQRAYEYGVGRKPSASEESWLAFTGEAFARDKYQFTALMRRIAMSSSFRAVSNEVVAAK